MKLERIWAMPNKWTFTIRPIQNLLKEEMGERYYTGVGWIDPFAGENSPAKITNDLNPDRPTTYHMEALDFVKMFEDESVGGVLFDPPYSPRQVKECYDNIGSKNWTGRVNFWSDIKNEIARILKPNGKVICCGWNSMGIGKGRGFTMQRCLIVPHGGSRNDTICTVETKTESKQLSIFDDNSKEEKVYECRQRIKKANKMLKDENVSLDKMVEYIESDTITSQETLREYICEQIKLGNFMSNVLRAVEDDTAADYFYFDYTCGSLCTPQPIYKKEDIMQHL